MIQKGWEEDFLNRGKSMDFWLWIHPLNSIFCSKYIVMINKMLLTYLYFNNKIKILVDGSRTKYRSRQSVWRVNSFSEHSVSLLVCKILIFLTLQGLGGQSPQPVFLGREQSHFSTHVPYTYCYFLSTPWCQKGEGNTAWDSGNQRNFMPGWGPKEVCLLKPRSSDGPDLPMKRNNKAA